MPNTENESLNQAAKNYLENDGTRCPFCGSKKIRAYSPDVDGATVWISVDCEDCKKEWEDQYQLIGFTHNDNFHPND